MLQLYTSPICPYCRKVEHALDEAGIAYEERSVTEPQHRDTVVELGGQMQVPFLVDPEREVHMYESNDIIEYARTHYGDSTTATT